MPLSGIISVIMVVLLGRLPVLVGVAKGETVGVVVLVAGRTNVTI